MRTVRTAWWKKGESPQLIGLIKALRMTMKLGLMDAKDIADDFSQKKSMTLEFHDDRAAHAFVEEATQLGLKPELV